MLTQARFQINGYGGWRDDTIKQYQGFRVFRFTVATSWKDPRDKNWYFKFYNFSAFDKVADIAYKYVHLRARLGIEGIIVPRNYNHKQFKNLKIYTYQLRATRITSYTPPIITQGNPQGGNQGGSWVRK